jgi:UDP-3-O-[3-hydroxymyristoyl] glucosamine N-acyltransferase
VVGSGLSEPALWCERGPDCNGWNGAADILQATPFVDAGRDRRADGSGIGRPGAGRPGGPGAGLARRSRSHHLAFFDNLRYADQLKATKAGACLVSPRFEAQVPAHVAVLRAGQPFRAFVKLARDWHADALRPQSWFDNDGIAPSAIIDPSAHLEDGVIVDPLAVIGPRVEIGAGTVIGAGAVIGADVKIGRDCNVGARSAIQFSLIGNNVLIHPACSIGQDGLASFSSAPRATSRCHRPAAS